MNCEIRNLSRRLVSVHCNSGKTCHLPPGYKHKLPEQELAGNPSVKKLQDRKLIAITQLAITKASKNSGEDTGTADTGSEKEGGAEQPSKNNPKQ